MSSESQRSGGDGDVTREQGVQTEKVHSGADRMR